MRSDTTSTPGGLDPVDSQQPSRPLFSILGLAAAALLVQFTLDAVSFRTGYYADYVEPESYAGSYETVLNNEGRRRLIGSHRALVFGDSSIAEGFSARLANLVAPNNWFFSSVGTPGATPRAWFYLLRDLDPGARRYNVIVLPMVDYADADGIYRPDIDKEADRDLDLNRLIVRLRLPDTLDFPFTWLDAGKKLSALCGTLFKGLVYSQDITEFLRHPELRLRKVELFREHSLEWQDSYLGRPESLYGLQYDSARNRFTLPAALPLDIRKGIEELPPPGARRVDGYRRRYREKWLGAIIEHYQQAGATIVLFRVPSRPIPIHVSIAANGTRFVDHAKRQPNVVVLDEQLFADLETPKLFFDSYHRTRRGGRSFLRVWRAP